MITFVGFAPDLPPETPGIFTDCSGLLPGVNSFVGAPSPVDTGLGTINSAALGFAVTRTSANTARVFAGTSSKLYEQATGAWSDKSKTGGYATGEGRWRFSQFGDVTLAASKSETLQAITSGNFADASASAPRAAIVETINNQVFVFNINGMGFGDQPDRWACSALGSYTDFVPSVVTQCVSNQLLDTPGAITAGKRLGDIIVAYKERGMYVGQYVGAPSVWSFSRMPGEIGAPCQEAVVSTGVSHYFVGNDDFYAFDGTRPVSLNTPIRKWFFSKLDKAYAYKIHGTYDAFNKRIYWWFPTSETPGVLTHCVVLNVLTGHWGKFSLPIAAACDYVSSGVTYDSLGSVYATYADLPTNISYDSPFWNSGSSVLAVIMPDRKCYQLSGVSVSSSLVTGCYGDNISYSTIFRVRPRFLQAPSSSLVNYSYSDTDDGSFTSALSSSFGSAWYDVLWSSRWHKFEFVFNGPVAISGFDPIFSDGGGE